ncbi:hypothetical protein JCM1841_003615 [Sporobolomyces salmonicolor]
MPPLTSSPTSLAAPLPPTSSSSTTSPPRSPRLRHGALAPAAGGSGSTNSSGSGTGRGRRISQSRGSVQSRRSAASLGLGVQFAAMNELTSSFNHVNGNGSGGSPSPSPSRAYSPPPPMSPTAQSHSRRSSLTFAPLPTPSNTSPSATTSTPAPSGTASRIPSRRPSLTHLASFLSGIEHHTRVRSPGGRGVSRSASRSQSRAGGRRGGTRGTSYRVNSDGSELEEEPSEAEEDAEEESDYEGGFMFGAPSYGSGRRRRTGTASSRASSIRSRRSSISRVEGDGGSPHPLLHELVRENTTGGVAPADAGKASSVWEETFETYKPSVLTTPTTPRIVRPPQPTFPDEEPFLDTSAPNSPIPRRSRTYDSLAPGGHDLSTVEVFEEGERIGVDVWLEGRGGWVRDCFAGRAERDGKAPGNGLDGPKQLEVERRLGEGTYAIVYLVREVLYDPDPTDDDILSPIDPFASFEFGDSPSTTGTSRPRLHSWASDVYLPPSEPTYGRYYALKCLCKKDLTDELIEVQRGEAVLHRALPQHENIVQLYGAYETDDWLFLVLEYVPGNDLFFWLLESQQTGTDHLYSRAASPSVEFEQRHSFDSDEDPDEGALSRTVTADTPAHLLMDQTPPSPSLLSSAVGNSLLSRKRLRLISRMFGQMCAAVQACHDVGIAHRDIKPENFIVVDGKGDKRSKAVEGAMKASAGRVVVKITDWGLGTMEDMCEDFDCGSKPYMAYECRNNLRPTYDPRQADVWSLGLVLLNLLYHRNPWADPSLNDPDFAEYVDDPVGFLKERFEGIGDEVASFLADRVFCDVLEVVEGKQRTRVTAGEFGKWASKLVMMMGEDSQSGHHPPLLTNESAYSAFDFSPVTNMAVHIPSALPPTASLLSQFAPSTVKPSSSLFDDLPADLRTELPNVPEEPELAPKPMPAYITSPSALSEDDSLPSPTFSSPQLSAAAPTSPESLYSPLPSAAASPDRTFTAEISLPPAPLAYPWSSTADSTANSTPQVAPPSAISLLAARRPSLVEAQQDSAGSYASTLRGGSEAGEDKFDEPEDPVEGEVKSGGETTEGADKARTKRRKRGARKEKRAARQANSEPSSPPALSHLGSSSKLGTLPETPGRAAVLEDLAAASQELARELSSARSHSSSRSARTRPVPSSRSHGTQSASAIQSAFSSSSDASAPKKGGGMFGRLRTLVNEGNPDLEAFKRRIDERNASIGAKADTYSAPAKMQGGRRPGGAGTGGPGTPYSSRGSVGTASWGSSWSGIEGGDEAPHGRGGKDSDPWSSASSRRERLNDRRQRTNGGGSGGGDFSSSAGSSSTRANGAALSAFDSSRNHTPLSSFSSVGSTSSDIAVGTSTGSMATVRARPDNWRAASTSPHSARPYSSSRSKGAAPLSPQPKLKDAATDTSDLGSPLPSPPPPLAGPTSSMSTRSMSALSSTSTATLDASAPAPALAPAPPMRLSPSPVSPAPASPHGQGKTNKLAKMLNSISVFNRAQAPSQGGERQG